MNIQYDLETDIRYKQGKKIGKEEAAKKALPAFLNRIPDISIKELAGFYDLPMYRIREILKELGLKARK